MDHLQRLIFVALVTLAAWLPASSYASFPATQTNTGACTVAPCSSYQIPTKSSPVFSSGAGVCGWFQTYQVTTGNPGYVFTVAPYYSTNSCQYTGSMPGYSPIPGSIGVAVQSVAPSAPVYSCSSGAALSGSTCTCQAPTLLQIGTDASSTCVSPDAARCDAIKGGSDLFTGYSSFPAFGSAYCPNNGTSSGCGATIAGGFAGVKNGVKVWTYEVKYTGVPCTPPPVGDPGVGKETTCKGTEGVVNGVTVCVPASKNDTNVVESEKKDTAADGTTTTEQDEVTCNGAKCTTTKTITTTPPGGTPTTKVVTSEEPKEDYCTKNPRASMCLTSGFSGACNSPPVCDGDAIQCAIAAQALKTACALTTAPTDDASINAFNTAAAQSQGDQTAAITSVVNIGASNFDQTELLGTAAALQDQLVILPGLSMAGFSTPAISFGIPWSKWNDPLRYIGWLAQAVVFVLCARIVMRG